MAIGGDEANVTELLRELQRGESGAADRLIPVVYDELHRLARYHLRGERSDHTLQTTELVHEAFLRLVGTDSLECVDRKHFFAISANVMRRVLVDYAKKKLAGKRGAGVKHVDLDAAQVGTDESWDQIIAVHDALDKLAHIHSRSARIVEMRFFTGLQLEEIAEVEQITTRTVRRDLGFAQTWLYAEMYPGGATKTAAAGRGEG